MVDITLKGKKSVCEVVVAPDEILKGKVLFAMCLHNADHGEILSSWAEDLASLLPDTLGPREPIPKCISQKIYFLC